MATVTAEDRAKREQEIADVVDRCRRALIDLPTEEKRAVWLEVDRWLVLEEGGDQVHH